MDALRLDSQNDIEGEMDMSLHVPWQAGVRRIMPGTTRNIVHCGGTILTPFWILTAAHCFYRTRDINDFVVRVGDLDHTVLERDEQELRIMAIYLHPNFSVVEGGVYDYDIALIRVRGWIRFGVNVQPAYVPSINSRVLAQSECYISGWGRSTSDPEGLPSHNVLQVAKVTVLDEAGQAICKEMYLNLTTPRMICAGYLDGTAIDSCAGDSGGPLVCKMNEQNVVVGITSWGTQACAVEGYPGIYTNVQSLLNWIRNPHE